MPYHIHVAARKPVRKNGKKKKTQGYKAVVAFFVIFFAIVAGVFVVNAATIKKNFNLFVARISSPPGTEDHLSVERLTELAIEEKPAEPAVQPPPKKPEPTKPPATTPTPDKPAVQPPPPVKPPSEPPAPQKPVQTRDRNIYFAQIDKDGQILQSKVTRKIPVSDSPMHDALNVLLTGPSADELNKGILNLIPQNTRILLATVRGSTAYISFSEDFLFNTFGVEGYVAQLRQIVWTVTEFSNVKDVQILVEGKRLDYLGEGIWIGSPINRQSF